MCRMSLLNRPVSPLAVNPCAESRDNRTGEEPAPAVGRQTFIMRAITVLLCLCFAVAVFAVEPVDESSGRYSYQVLATNKTSTLEKELNAAGQLGFRLVDMKGGETLGGDEVVTVVQRPTGDGPGPRYEYRVLATNKTSTMQKELSAVGAQGYVYIAQAVSPTTFGGQEVLVVVGREENAPLIRYAYRLLATKRTKTMGQELNEAADDGYAVVGLTVSTTTFGGHELISIMMREE
jgi:hypothetical protein